MKNFIEVYDNALSKDECKSIIDFFEETNICQDENGFMCKKEGMTGFPPRVDKNIKNSTDIGMSFNLSGHYINQMIMKSLAKHTRKYIENNIELKLISTWGILDYYNLQKYEPNQAYFGLHCENEGPNFGINRVLVWMFYLNTVTDDGGTYFDNYDLTLNAVEGRCVIWPAYWTHMHRGIVSKTESKYIVTGWFNFIDNV